MKEQLLNPQKISEQHDQTGREAVLSEAERIETAARTLNERIAEIEGRKMQLPEEIKQAEQQAQTHATALSDRLQTLVVRLKIKIGVEDSVGLDLSKKKESAESAREALLKELEEIEKEINVLRAQLKELPQTQALLDAYHEKMRELPLPNKEKRELLTPEFLASLSTDEYIQLWRRLNPHYLSHVTRQGFRDHTGMLYHTGGMNEFADGFTSVMKDGKEVRTPLAIEGLRARDKDSVRKYLEAQGIFEAEDAEKAVRKLLDLTDFTMASAPKYPDKSAVHFAAQEVADSHYGAETDNEVFFLYPSDVVASQHAYTFNGWQHDFTKPQSEKKWNDVFVWPNTAEEGGIPVDAGFVFLPKSTLVDPENGSKYASELISIDNQEKLVIVRNKELAKNFTDWLSNLNEKSPIVIVLKKCAEKGLTHEEYDANKKQFDELLQKNLNEIGFIPETMSELMFVLTSKLWNTPDQNCQLSKNVTHELLQSYSGEGVKCENGIPAKEYWEKYFEKHPELKPKHIVYYDGDPTTAVADFQRINKIGGADTSKDDGVLLGFDDQHVTNIQTDARSNVGYDELKATATQLISEHYQKTA